MRRAFLIAVGSVGLAAVAAPARADVTVYLRRDGGTLTSGWDDSAADVSSLASQGRGGEVTVPRWKGGERRWKKVTACVRERFEAFAIDIVEKRPAAGDYIMVMVGGRSSLLGYDDPVTGISPYTAEVEPNAVSFVFPDNIRNDVEGTCVSILHEVGHTLGLDHTYLCEDPMSYLFGCGTKTWQDVDAQCGEDEPRDCGTGESTQNSYQMLAANVGLRGEPRPRPEPEPQPEPEPGTDTLTVDPPTITLSAGELSLSDNGDRLLTFTAAAASRAGIAEVALIWFTGDRSIVIPCRDIPADVPASCTRDGDHFTFSIRVGTGERAVAAAAIDANGDHTVTDPRRLWLDD